MGSDQLKEALQLLQGGDAKGARRVLDGLPTDQLATTEGLVLRGISSLGMGDTTSALADLSRANLQKPGDPIIVRNLVTALLVMAAALPASEAADRYEAVLEIDPGNDKALLGLAQCLQECCDYEDAAALYDAYLTLRSDDARALIGHGYCLQELRREAEARAAYERALAADPKVRPLVMKSLSTASAGSVSLTGYAPEDLLTS